MYRVASLICFPKAEMDLEKRLDKLLAGFELTVQQNRTLEKRQMGEECLICKAPLEYISPNKPIVSECK